MPSLTPARRFTFPPPMPRARAAPAAATETVPGFFLFLILNATLFIRPSEIVPALLGWHIYLVLILLCFGLAFPAVLQHLAGRSLNTRPITVFLLGLLVMVVLSHLGHMELTKAAQSGFEFAKVVIYFLLVVTFINTPGRLRVFLYTFGLCSAVVTTLAILGYHGVIQVVNLSVLKDTIYDPNIGQHVIVPRLRGTGIFNDPNDLCLLLVVGILISLYGISDRPLGIGRIVGVATLVLFAYGLYLTKSRGGFLGLLVGLTVFLSVRFGWRRSLLLLLVVLPPLFILFAGRQTDLSATASTGQTRIQLWSDGFQLLKQNPLFGIGVNEYEKEAGQVAHNSFLHVFTEVGPLGGMLFVGMFYVAFWSLARLRLGGREIANPALRRLHPYLTALIAAYTTGMLTLSVAFIVPTYTILGLATVYLQMVTVYPPLPKLRCDTRLLGRIAGVSVLFLALLYVFVRLFINRS